MQEDDALIEIVDEKGKSLGHKQRKNVDKRKDILKAVYILLQNDEQKLLLSRSKSDPIYPNKWGSSAAGLIRHDETAEQAAKRTIKRELGINANLDELGRGFYDFSGVKRWMWMYCAKGRTVRQNKSDSDDAQWFSFAEAETFIKKDEAMPMLAPQLSALKLKNST